VFDFTDDQEDFRKTVRAFARERLLPGYNARAKSDEFPWSEYREAAQLGVTGIGISHEYGGTGEYDFIALGIACEELAYGDINVAVAPYQTGLSGDIIQRFADPSIRDRWLPSVVTGDVVIAIALTEPDSGADAAGMRMQAVPTGDGYVLDGEKTSTTLLRDAVATIVYAKVPPATPGGKPLITAFFVEHDRPGVSRGEFHDMGLNKIGRGSLALEQVFVPATNVIGEVGRGFSQVMAGFDFSRAGIGLQCIGAARASLDEVSRYVTQRQSFGKPLAAFQGVSLQIAEHYTHLEAARWLCYWTLWLRQQGRPHTAQAAMAKWYAPRVAVDAIESAMTLYGHVAWSDELPIQQRLRDTMGFLIGDGTAEIQKLVIAREYIGKEVLDR
jgi:cyclohexanecarboxyl-CoA dehydrogenase